MADGRYGPLAGPGNNRAAPADILRAGLLLWYATCCWPYGAMGESFVNAMMLPVEDEL